MKALRFARHGAPADVLQLDDMPTPTPGPGEALVEVHASAINPSDAKNVTGAFGHTTLPRVPGRDFAGRVVGGGAAWNGKDVFGSGSGLGFVRDGAHAEYVVVPEAALAEKPKSLTMSQAASVGVPYLTALEGLRRAAVKAGDSVLIVGAAGAVGRAVAQIAKWSGARVLGTTIPSDRVDDDAKRYVDVWIDLSHEGLSEAARAHTGGAGVDVGFNVVGGDTFGPSLSALAIGGRLIAISAAKDPSVSLDLRYFYRHDLQLIGLDSAKLSDPAIAATFRCLARGFEQGALAVGEAVLTPLSGAVEAYRSIEAGKPGKQVLLLRPAAL